MSTRLRIASGLLPVIPALILINNLRIAFEHGEPGYLLNKLLLILFLGGPGRRGLASEQPPAPVDPGPLLRVEGRLLV